MKRRAAILFAGAVFVLGLWSMIAYSQVPNNPTKQAAQRDVLNLVNAMGGNKGNVKAQAQAIKKKYEDLVPLMWVYKPRPKGGVGMGKKGAGIEHELNRLGGVMAQPNPAKDPVLKNDLIKAANISKVIAEVSDLYVELYAKKKPGKWKGYTKDMRKAADDLIQVSKGGNPVKVKMAINNLTASCTNCHKDFRDN